MVLESKPVMINNTCSTTIISSPITQACLQEGRAKSLALDISHDPSMDLATDLGFISTLYHTTCLRPGGGLQEAIQKISTMFSYHGFSAATDLAVITINHHIRYISLTIYHERHQLFLTAIIYHSQRPNLRNGSPLCNINHSSPLTTW